MSRYVPRRESRSEFIAIRRLKYHVRIWDSLPAVRGGGAQDQAAAARTVFLLHGWMDVSASFQFVVDHLPDHWRVISPDWRGFGLTDWPASMAPGTAYWQPDYLADLDALLDHYQADAPVDLVGHSMGGNVAMSYSGTRPARIARLVNLEGLGLGRTPPEQAPERMREWLDEVKAGPRLRDYPSLEAVAERLTKTNPRLRPEFAQFLARHWSQPVVAGAGSAAGPDSERPSGRGLGHLEARYQLLGDPAHKLVNPILYRIDESLAFWASIEAPVLFVLSEHLEDWRRFALSDEYQQRLAVIAHLQRATVTGAGHMLHHDQPETVAGLLRDFLS